MTGKKAVAEVLKRIKEGRCVKVWTADRSEEIAAHWCGMYVIFYQGKELCRGIRSEERRVGKECRSRWSPYH